MSIDSFCLDPWCRPLKLNDFKAVSSVSNDEFYDKVREFDDKFSDRESWEDKSLQLRLNIGLLSRYDTFMIRTEKNNPGLYRVLKSVGFPDYKENE